MNIQMTPSGPWSFPYIPDPSNLAVDSGIAFVVSALLAIMINAEAQAWVATVLGDVRKDAKDRFHFNVIFHMSIIGSLCYLVGGFGWPKPIDVDPTKFRHPRVYTFLVRLAGVVANILLANIAASLVLGIKFIEMDPLVFRMVLGVNVATAVFNLIPLPPLAGGFLVLAFIPERFARAKEMLILAGPYLILALALLDRIYPQLFLRAWIDPLALKVFTLLAGV